MCQRLTVMFFGVMAILLIGTPVGQAQTVVEFTILGPRVVLDDDQNSEVTFTVYVAATDANWRPILPVSSATITLTAYEAGTQNQLTMTAGSSFQSSATDIWTAVQVTLTGLNPNTEIVFQPDGGTFTASTLSATLELPVTLHDERGGEVRLIEVTVAYTQTTALQTVTTRERIKVVSAPEALL